MLPGTLSEVTIARDRVLIGSTDNFLYALDVRSGKERWKYRSGGDVIGAAATDEAIYYAWLDNILRALNRSNGNQRWMKATVTRPVLPPRVVRDEVLIVGLTPTLSTYDAKTGTAVNTYVGPGELQGEPLIDPVLRPFEVAVVIITRDGRIVALRPQSMTFREPAATPLNVLPGKPLPRERTPATPRTTDQPHSSLDP